MTEIKRPNYFTSQFLVEGDFNDEQAYHLTFRRRHNRVLHTSGVADGFSVTAVANAQPPKVTIAPGTAIDKDGNEIVLNDAVVYQLTTSSVPNVFLTVKYNDVLDPADKYAPAPEHFTRTTERPVFQDGTATPPSDGSVIVLAVINLNAANQIQSIDTSVRGQSSAKLGLGLVAGGTTGSPPAATGNIAARTVTGGNIAIGTVTGGNDGGGAATGNIAARTVSGGNIAIGAITGGATGTTATAGNIANGTITGAGNPAGTTTTGNIAIGTITGGTNGTTPTGNLAFNTVTGGATPVGTPTAGNIANGTITGAGASAGTTTTGNIAIGTITGGTSGNTATGNIAVNTITAGNIAANTIGVGQLALMAIGTGGALFKSATNFALPAGGTNPQPVDIPIVDDLGTQTAVVLFSAVVTGNPSVDAGPITWVEVTSYTAPLSPNPAKHGRKIRITNFGPAVSIDWKAIVFLI